MLVKTKWPVGHGWSDFGHLQFDIFDGYTMPLLIIQSISSSLEAAHWQTLCLKLLQP